MASLAAGPAIDASFSRSKSCRYPVNEAGGFFTG
jgi:hypothetical protein